jgi:hypothetical protein
MDWINRDKHRDDWQAVVGSVMNIKVRQDAWSFLTREELIAYAMQLVIGN